MKIKPKSKENKICQKCESTFEIMLRKGRDYFTCAVSKVDVNKYGPLYFPGFSSSISTLPVNMLERVTEDHEKRDVLMEHAGYIYRAGADGIPDAEDIEALKRRYEAVREEFLENLNINFVEDRWVLDWSLTMG